MTLFTEHLQPLHARIEALEAGTEFRLHELFGDEWSGLGTAGQRKGFGISFKNAVEHHEFPNVTWVRHETSPNVHVYSRN